MEEVVEFRKIPGFSNYIISNNGKIKNVILGRYITIKSNKRGYHSVSIVNDNKQRKNIGTHRLVALTFIGPPPDDGKVYTIDHLNRIKDDNRVQNLRWATALEQAKNRDDYNGNTERPVWKLDIVTGTQLERYASVTSAAKAVGCHVANISQACRGAICGGFKWKYDEVEILEGEIWKTVENSSNNGIDAISNLGRARMKRGRISSSNSKYPRTRVNGKNQYLHIIAAHTFLDPPTDSSKTTVNHKNRDTKNYAADNLEWASPKEQMLHVVKTGRKQFSRAVNQFTLEGAFIKQYSSIRIAMKQSGLKNIHSCCRGKKVSAGGFIWKYVDESQVRYDQKNISINSNVPKSNAREVTQYLLSDKNTIIATFDSITHASKSTGVNYKGISAVCKSKNLSAGGFFWQYNKPTKRVNTYMGYAVDKLSIHMEYLQTYKCIQDAADDNNVLPENIYNVLRGTQNLSGGFRWRYSEEDIDTNQNSPKKRIKLDV